MIWYRDVFSNINKKCFQDNLDNDFVGNELRILKTSIKSSEPHQVHASSRLPEQPQAFNLKVSKEKESSLYSCSRIRHVSAQQEKTWFIFRQVTLQLMRFKNPNQDLILESRVLCFSQTPFLPCFSSKLFHLYSLLHSASLFSQAASVFIWLIQKPEQHKYIISYYAYVQCPVPKLHLFYRAPKINKLEQSVFTRKEGFETSQDEVVQWFQERRAAAIRNAPINHSPVEQQEKRTERTVRG